MTLEIKLTVNLKYKMDGLESKAFSLSRTSTPAAATPTWTPIPTATPTWSTWYCLLPTLDVFLLAIAKLTLTSSITKLSRKLTRITTKTKRSLTLWKDAKLALKRNPKKSKTKLKRNLLNWIVSWTGPCVWGVCMDFSIDLCRLDRQ